MALAAGTQGDFPTFHGQVRGRLVLALGITCATLVAEVLGGYLANSLALLSDAGHVFTHLFALVLAWVGIKQEGRAATARMTFGYHRVGMLTAVINALALLGIAVFIVYEAYGRFREPPQVRSLVMLVVAMAGLGSNLAVVWLLMPFRRASLNIRGAFLHVLGDALSSVGVIVGAIVIAWTGWLWVDPAASVFIALVIAYGAWGILREGMDTFLEASPRHVDLDSMVAAMSRVPGVRAVHDLHVWTISSSLHAMSCHVLTDDAPVSQTNGILSDLTEVLRSRFHIEHVTLQLEHPGCQSPALLCSPVVQQGELKEG